MTTTPTPDLGPLPEDTLHWHALNYRTAHTLQAEQAWQALDAFVSQKIAAAQEALSLIAAPQRPDGSWNRDREACRQTAADALAGVAAERERTALALKACAIAQECIKAAYEDRWASFDALSDDFDDALAAVADPDRAAGVAAGVPALESHQVYIRALCRAVDAATDFAGTVAGGASWWDEVWAEHVAELDGARAALASPTPPAEPAERPCTCHPDDNPPQPCAKRYALSECRAAAPPQAAQPPAHVPESRFGNITLREAVDEFMAHQVTGTRQAMSALQRLVDAADAAAQPPQPVQAQAAEPAPAQWVSVTDGLPPSGKTVLACYTNRAGNVRRIRAEWVAEKSREANSDESDIGVYDEATDTFYDPPGWYERIDNWGDYSAVTVTEGEVTHWTDLPPAPTGPAPAKDAT